MYSIYEDLPQCAACGSSVEPWIELQAEEGARCSRCRGELGRADARDPDAADGP